MRKREKADMWCTLQFRQITPAASVCDILMAYEDDVWDTTLRTSFIPRKEAPKITYRVYVQPSIYLCKHFVEAGASKGRHVPSQAALGSAITKWWRHLVRAVEKHNFRVSSAELGSAALLVVDHASWLLILVGALQISPISMLFGALLSLFTMWWHAAPCTLAVAFSMPGVQCMWAAIALFLVSWRSALWDAGAGDDLLVRAMSGKASLDVEGASDAPKIAAPTTTQAAAL